MYKNIKYDLEIKKINDISNNAKVIKSIKIRTTVEENISLIPPSMTDVHSIFVAHLILQMYNLKFIKNSKGCIRNYEVNKHYNTINLTVVYFCSFSLCFVQNSFESFQFLLNKKHTLYEVCNK